MPQEDRYVEHLCPAKVNLTLFVTGKRADGFHALHSVVAQTRFGDSLRLEWRCAGSPEEDGVLVDGGGIPDGENTISKALRLYRESAGFNRGAFTARLTKRIPVGAGLGGGSSDAVATLKALQDMFGEMTYGTDWNGIATQIGSDCRLFLEDGPVVMEGRGEMVSPLPADLAARLRGAPVVLFKPDFSISTPEAYRRLANGRYYSDPARVRPLMDAWREGEGALPAPHNDFERLVADWMPTIGVVLHRLRHLHGLDARLSGSGSACFVFTGGRRSAIPLLRKELGSAWGKYYWLEETELH
jgi:4-diphosphocytidyl-2-C-methyl-D-erythritol kinase